MPMGREVICRKMNKTRLSRDYSVLLPLFPILTIYGFQFLPYVTFSDCLLLLFIIMDVLLNGGKVNICKTFIPLIVYLSIQPFLLLLYASDDLDFVDAAGTTWKLALYIFGIALLSKNLDKKAFVKSMRLIGTANTIYGFFQFVLGTYAHILLSPYLPLLPVLRTGLDDHYREVISYGWVVRPRAWFSEPSTFAIFLLLALAVELFVLGREERRKKICFIYTFGIIISRSSTGIVGLIALLLSWILICPADFLHKIPKKVLQGILCVFPICSIILYIGGFVTSFIDHTFEGGQGLAAQSHFAYISAAFQGQNFNTLEQLFGHGRQEVATGYLPGWVGTYYCLGIIGVILYINGFIKSLKHSSEAARIIVLTFIFLNFGTEIMLGVFMLLYMSAASLQDDSCEDEWNEHSIRCFDFKDASL